MKNKTGEILLQIIPVMIGVFLGFLVSNWADTSKSKSQIKLLKRNIRAEIESNNKKIQDVIEYHEMLRDSARYYLKEGKFNRNSTFFSGIRTSLLTNSAFETGNQTGLINGFPFDHIQKVNHVYTQQDFYNDFTTLLLSGLVTMDIHENEDGLRKFYRYLAITMSDVVIQEKELLKQYDELLIILKEE